MLMPAEDAAFRHATPLFRRDILRLCMLMLSEYDEMRYIIVTLPLPPPGAPMFSRDTMLRHA